MSQAYQQSAIATEGAGSSIALAYSSNNLLGGLLVAVVWWYAGSTMTCTVADSNGSWLSLPAIPLFTTDAFIQLFYKTNCIAGANTVTATFSGVTLIADLVIGEYSGANTLAQHAEGVVAASSQLAGQVAGVFGNISPNITTTATDILIGYGGEFGADADSILSPFMNRQGNSRNAFGDQLNIVAGTYHAVLEISVTSSTSASAAGIVAFSQVNPPTVSISPTSGTFSTSMSSGAGMDTLFRRTEQITTATEGES